MLSVLVFAAAVDFGGPQRAERAAAIASILGRPIFHECVARLQNIALWTSYEPPVPRSAQGFVAAFGQRSSGQAADSLLPQATVADCALHMLQHMDMQHPNCVAARAVLDAGLRAAVRYVADFRNAPNRLKLDRQCRLKCINRCSVDLEPLTEECRRWMPRHILDMKEPRIHIALLACCVQACGLPDAQLHIDCALGFRVCGEIGYSGMFKHDPDAEATADYETMQQDAEWCNSAWNSKLHERLIRDGSNPAKAEEVAAVWSASIKEANTGWIKGPFSWGVVKARFQDGLRIIRRFCVPQKGALRPCDDCKGNRLNACLKMHERLVCCTPELAADIAAEFSDTFGDFDWKPQFCTDDVEKAYRRLGTATPFLTVVAVTDPRPKAEGGLGVAYFVLPGHNFGLKSAPVAFNRAAACMSLCSNRLLGICCGHYYDDFLTLEPRYAASWGKHFLREFMKTVGLPLSDDVLKNVAYGAVNLFLGVQTDFSQFHMEGQITMRVTAERVASIILTMEEMITDSTLLTSGGLSSLCGRLRFALCWTFGRFGSAGMQPLEAYGNDNKMSSFEAVTAALQFFVTVLGLYKQGRGLVRLVRLGRPSKPPVIVWSDAMWEKSSSRPAGLGFVIFVPPDVPSGRGRLIHSSVFPDERTIGFFMQKKQYIGQLELLAATACYYSLPDIFRDRDVVHFVDNTSAIAALIKGYSGVPDSARIVHAFHSLNAGLRMNVWFQYVASKANVSDLPSRAADDELMEVLQRFEHRCDIDREPVEMVIPPFDKWNAPFSVWLEHVAAAAGGSQKRSRPR